MTDEIYQNVIKISEDYYIGIREDEVDLLDYISQPVEVIVKKLTIEVYILKRI